MATAQMPEFILGTPPHANRTRQSLEGYKFFRLKPYPHEPMSGCNRGFFQTTIMSDSGEITLTVGTCNGTTDRASACTRARLIMVRHRVTSPKLDDDGVIFDACPPGFGLSGFGESLTYKGLRYLYRIYDQVLPQEIDIPLRIASGFYNSLMHLGIDPMSYTSPQVMRDFFTFYDIEGLMSAWADNPFIHPSMYEYGKGPGAFPMPPLKVRKAEAALAQKRVAILDLIDRIEKRLNKPIEEAKRDDLKRSLPGLLSFLRKTKLLHEKEVRDEIDTDPGALVLGHTEEKLILYDLSRHKSFTSSVNWERFHLAKISQMTESYLDKTLWFLENPRYLKLVMECDNSTSSSNEEVLFPGRWGETALVRRTGDYWSWMYPELRHVQFNTAHVGLAHYGKVGTLAQTFVMGNARCMALIHEPYKVAWEQEPPGLVPFVSLLRTTTIRRYSLLSIDSVRRGNFSKPFLAGLNGLDETVYSDFLDPELFFRASSAGDIWPEFILSMLDSLDVDPRCLTCVLALQGGRVHFVGCPNMASLSAPPGGVAIE